MRTLTLYMRTTTDGFIAGPQCMELITAPYGDAPTR